MIDHIKKYFQKLSPSQRQKIYNKLEEVEKYGINAADVKPLKGHKGLYHLRIGRLIRIVFCLKDNKAIIIDADNRDSIYKK